MPERFEAEGHAGLVYDELGERAAAAVVLLHGGSGTRANWTGLAERLAARRRVIVPDLRGHGDSEKPGSYRIEDYAGDVAALVEQRVGAPVALVGHSLGGVVAAQVAGTRPELVERAFFEDAPLHWTSGEDLRTGAQRPFVTEEFRSKVEAGLDRGASVAELSVLAVQEAMETADFFRPQQQVLFARRERGASVDELVESLQATLDAFGVQDAFPAPLVRALITGLLACDPRIFDAPPDWLDAYDPKRPMRCPVLMLRADPSFGPPPVGAAFPPEAEAEFLATHPKARVEFVEGASHGIHFQMPERFARSLEAFLDA